MARKKKTNTLDKVPPTLTLSPQLNDALVHFFRCNPPKKFSRGLRNMVVELMSHQEDGHRFYLFELMLGLEMFFDVLDMAEDEGLEVGKV